MNKRNLYIIGNGFDLYHGLQTSYISFAKYLFENDIELYDSLLKYFELPDIDNENSNIKIWSDFETKLSKFDFRQVLDDYSGNTSGPSEDEVSERGLNALQINMEKFNIKLINNLIQNMNSFIQDRTYPNDLSKKKIYLKPNSLFLNFNYTDTLERIYKIKKTQICYIHNKSENEESRVIIGHGTNPSNFNEKKSKPPTGLSNLELRAWNDDMGDNYDFYYEIAKNEILSFFVETFKNTEKIIKENDDFFKRLMNVNNVYILGHSISKIDFKYFKKVINQVDKNSIWNISYFKEIDKNKHKVKFLKLGISETNLKLIKIDELKIS